MIFVIADASGEETIVRATSYRQEEGGDLSFHARGREIGRVLDGNWVSVLPLDPSALKDMEDLCPSQA